MAYKKTATSVNDFVGRRPAVVKDNVSVSSVAGEGPVNSAGGNDLPRRRIHISSSSETPSSTPLRPSTATFEEQAASSVAAASVVQANPTHVIEARPVDSGRVSGYQPMAAQSSPTELVRGFLDVQIEGHGFLRPKFIPSARDIYISQSQIRRFMLRPGDQVEGLARPPKDTERYFGLLKVENVNGIPADDSLRRPYFDDLTPIYPNRQVILATGKTPLSTRIIDLVAPIGFGQRGMIVSPPKAGKTTILKEIAAGISKNFPKAHLMAALIGERPEEVTDISMSVHGEVVASNFDEPPDNQTRVAEITLERAKRMVELGKDVIILLDSITRLARAYNLSVDPSGRTLSGGFDPAALYPAKRFFGAARNCKEGGSLTIIGTALVETGSRMDDLIYEEFKGTGNMELHLVRALAERRIFPAISIEKSGTRGEERILAEGAYKKIVTMRRMMDMLGQDERTSILVERLSKVETNEAFLETLGRG
jgi:transcription termination factor Rho